MKTVGILYICTGKYSIFWEDFFINCEKNFLPNSEKHYFVFTDDEVILKIDNPKIHTIFQQTEEWPYPTLKRFEYFCRVKEQLLLMDYVVFMNGNLIVNVPVYEDEILPKEENLFVTLHPGFFDKARCEYTYDNNPKCTAYVSDDEGTYYFAGGFNGGKSEAFVSLMKVLKDRIQRDLQNDVIALWHDESQLNRYLIDYGGKFKMLSPAYLYPEGWDLPFEQKIIVLDKQNKGGHEYLRER